jgi:hypothetical protein
LRLSAELIEVTKEGVTVVVNGHPPSRHVLVDLLLALLPAVLPEPALISRDRQRRPKLENAVLTFSDLDLRTRLVEMQPTSNVCG